MICFILEGLLGPGRTPASHRRVRSIPEATALVDLPSRLHSLWVLCVQPTLHDGLSRRLLVCHSRTGQPLSGPAETDRNSVWRGWNVQQMFPLQDQLHRVPRIKLQRVRGVLFFRRWPTVQLAPWTMSQWMGIQFNQWRHRRRKILIDCCGGEWVRNNC